MSTSATPRSRKIEPSELKHSAGWLSPEGKFFTCSPFGHNHLAHLILNYEADKMGLQGRERLSWIQEHNIERRGWVKVHLDGMLSWGTERICPDLTSRQIAALQDLGELFPMESGKRLSDLLRMILEYHDARKG